MFLKKPGFTVPLALLFLLGWTFAAIPNLEYRDRGNRYEGRKSSEVSGFHIELLSAVVDYTEAVEQMPDRLKLKFYLAEQSSQVFVIVRELVNRYDYWMDRVRPQNQWQSGFDNNFQWPTTDVLRRLDHIKMDELGAVARLDRQSPSANEKVAPVIFYHSQPPTTIQGYLFTFKTIADARLTCSLYREGTNEPLFARPCPTALGDKPFTVRWNSATAMGGWYRLVLSGAFVATKNRIQQSVRFFHQPEVE